MPHPATGSHYERNGAHFARVTIEGDKRRSFALDGCRSADEAATRAAKLAALAVALRRAGMADRAEGVLVQAAPSPAETVEALAKRIAAGAYTAPPASTAPTIATLAKRWTTGELAREYPDHIREKRSARDDEHRFRNHILPIVGDVRVDAFTLADAEKVMRGVPEERSRATRRHVAQLLHKLFAYAVYPLRLIATSPLPRGFLPRLDAEKAKGAIFPDEDRRLLASPAVPLAWRLVWGVLHREGCRFSEAASLTWADIDLERGSLTLDANKTDRRGFWPLAPGVAAALLAWKARREEQGGKLGPADPVLVDEDGAPLDPEGKNAERYRAHLLAAGIDRPQLFASTAERRQIRAHDCRAAFVTIGLANGRSESWISRRTGHKSSAQIATYTRLAETVAELDLGDWTPLAAAIPELAGEGSGTGSGTAGTGEPPRRARDGSKSSIVPRSTEGGSRTHKPFRVADFESEPTTAIEPDRHDSPGFGDHPGARSVADGAPRAASERPSAASGSALAHLAAAVAAAVAEGDMDAARELSATLARLLAKPAEPSGNVLTLDPRKRRAR